MLILGIDSSAGPASAALVEDGCLLGEFYIHTKQTHSQTLLPMVQQLLASAGRSCGDLDALAVSHGPGSFTGVRIGISCVKGISFSNDIPCVGISTLKAIAYGGLAAEGSVLCAAMDARCSQVYNALFQVEHGVLRRLTEDRALSIAELETQCRSYWGMEPPCATRRFPSGGPGLLQKICGFSTRLRWRCWENALFAKDKRFRQPF